MSFDPTPDVPCGAIADRLDILTGGGEWNWRVTVVTPRWWSRQIRKVYFIVAPSDTLAAREGIRRFVEEARQEGARRFTTVH